MIKTFKVALLISTYNWPQALKVVLDAINRQTVLPDEILIADDGSRPETTELIERYKEALSVPVKHAWHEDKGFRKTIVLNKAIKLSTADYIVEIDGDILTDSRFIEDHIRNASKNFFIQGSRGMVNKATTQKVLSGELETLSFLSTGVSNWLNAVRLPFLSKFITSKGDESKKVKACNIAFWKDDFIKINGYNNDFNGWGYEDYELAARFINAGIKKKRLKFSAICFHLFHEQTSRSAHEKHGEIYERTLALNLTRCDNGYAEI